MRTKPICRKSNHQWKGVVYSVSGVENVLQWTVRRLELPTEELIEGECINHPELKMEATLKDSPGWKTGLQCKKCGVIR